MEPCDLPFGFTPSALVLSATQDALAAPASVALANLTSSGAAYSVVCTGGITASPASGALGGGASVTLTVQAPAQSSVGASSETCTVSQGQGSTSVALPVTLVVSASYPSPDAGAYASDSGVGPAGGSVEHLYFAVVGDSRPANIDDVANYPSAVINQIYQGVDALSPRPQFVVATGDYMYANTNTYTAQPQASLYMQARAGYQGTVFPAMGNHECDGYTADNCTVNQTQNNQAFMGTILAPLQLSLPYYSIPLRASDGSWTAKLLVIACNAWDANQEAWLTQALAQPTTYTLLVRHEPAADNTGPCVNAVEALMVNNPYDLSLVGHTHEFYGKSSSKELVVGNGGAPLSSGTYGYVTIEQVSGGWAVKNYDYSTGLPVNSFTIP